MSPPRHQRPAKGVGGRRGRAADPGAASPVSAPSTEPHHVVALGDDDQLDPMLAVIWHRLESAGTPRIPPGRPADRAPARG